MKPSEIKNDILQFTNDIVYEYKDETIWIGFSSPNDLIVGYKEITKHYTDIDDLMKDPIYDGKSLRQISKDIE